MCRIAAIILPVGILVLRYAICAIPSNQQVSAIAVPSEWHPVYVRHVPWADMISIGLHALFAVDKLAITSDGGFLWSRAAAPHVTDTKSLPGRVPRGEKAVTSDGALRGLVP